jgi:hypothetical protein
MANIQKRGDRLPRSTREAKAYRSLQVGGAAGVGFIVTTVLAVAGVIGALLPIVLLIATLGAGYRFLKITGQR